MNQKFKELMIKYEFEHVPMNQESYESFYDIVINNFEWMYTGKGEGLVLVTPPAGP